MLKGRLRIGGGTLLAALLLTTAAHAQAPTYEVVSRDDNGLEIRFHGMPLKSVHADDSQNALSLDFQNPVDGAAFDHLASDMPQWVSMAYANFDNGVIRSPRPVTFLTRAEPDGFSLRIVARGGPVAQNAPPPPQMRGQYQEYGPPPPGPYVPPQAAYQGFHGYGAYAGLRNYEGEELSLRRADPMWGLAYERASMQSDSSIGIRSEANWYHGGDLMIATNVDGKLSIAPGIAFVGDVQYTNVTGRTVRLADGTLAATTSDQIVTGIGGLALEMGRDTELKLEASAGNDTMGGRLSVYTGAPDSFVLFTGDYHTPDLDTPTAAATRADKDQATLGGAQQFAYGLWGNAAGHYIRYGVHGDADVAQTAGWDAGLRWQTDVYDGLLAGLAYDGHGEYLLSNDSRTGTAPTPFTPLGIRNMENHAMTATLSSSFGSGFWFSAYAGYVMDRFASDGLLAGLDLHYTPTPGVDFALGARQSAVSYTQGERGRQTTAGLNMTLGFGDPPKPSWMMNSL